VAAAWHESMACVKEISTVSVMVSSHLMLFSKWAGSPPCSSCANLRHDAMELHVVPRSYILCNGVTCGVMELQVRPRIYMWNPYIVTISIRGVRHHLRHGKVMSVCFERCLSTCAAVQEACVAVTSSRIASDIQTSLFWQSQQLTKAYQFVHTPSTNILMHVKTLKPPMKAKHHGYSSMIWYGCP